jgi:cytochrome c oxidase subunit 1
MFGRMMSEVLGQVHFWLTFLFVNVTFLPMFPIGFLGHQRRIANPNFFEFLRTPQIEQLHDLATIGAVGLLLSQIPFLVNLFWSMARGRKAEANPWKANTLEWVPPSPPPHGNWEGEIPVVYRGPYEYSAPGQTEDWLPQNARP